MFASCGGKETALRQAGNLLKINLPMLAAARLHGHDLWGCAGCCACCKGKDLDAVSQQVTPPAPAGQPSSQEAWALLACVRLCAACCFSATEDHRSSHLGVYYIQYSPGLKSVVEDPIVPKTVELGCLSPSGLAQTVGSPWVWSTFYLHSTKQK